MSEKLIFVTNDDGVHARGLARMIEMLRPLGHIVVVAPETAQSGMAHAITMGYPLYLREVRHEAGLDVYACSGTPVDCVKMALEYLLTDKQIDLACSGINHGSNAAINILYSGTMGAAIESSFYDIPSIGFSLDDHSESADLEASGLYVSRIAGAVLDARPALPLCLNVNIPVGRPSEIKGAKVCRQARGAWREGFLQRQDPRGKEYFWLTGEFQDAEPEATDTDQWALTHGYVSIVPIQVDLTNHSQLAPLSQLFI
ncbi:MAG: 5'/3'-nucleotidase SurE [Rikenellaceae bacterium]|jgi:5'-nucleotidase|nr:5'/3'-nucleotidase SurE [Rikenellaceae bacterium]